MLERWIFFRKICEAYTHPALRCVTNMFLRSDVVMRNVLRRWCLFLGANSYSVFAWHGRKHLGLYYKDMGKHFLGRPVTLPVSCTKGLTRMPDDSKEEPDIDDNVKDALDNDFFEETFEVPEARQLLYPRSEDPVIKLLNSSVSVQDVFDVVCNPGARIDACSLSQAALVLWDLQKVFCEVNIKNFPINREDYSDARPEDVFRNYVTQIRAHPSFEHLVDLVGRHVHELSMDALTCTLFCLGKMGVEMHHPVMHAILSRCLSVMESDGGNVSLPVLSRFIAAVQTPGLWSVFVMKEAMPLIYQKMETCGNVEDFHLLTTCLIGSHRLLDLRWLVAYKQLAERLSSKGELNGQHPRAVLKATYFLNYPPWSQMNCGTVRRLLLQFVGNVHSLLAADLVFLHRIFMNQLEPAELLGEMRTCASHLLANSDRCEGTPLSSLQCELLECVVAFSLPSQKHVFEELTLQYLEESSFVRSIASLFKVLRYLKTSDRHLSDRFWSLTVKFLQEHEEEREDFKLLKICHRYMHFSSHLGSMYRHPQFEGQMLQWLWEDLNTNITSLIPSKFFQVASFALAYAGGQSPGHARLLGLVMEKLPGMMAQFNEIDCLNMSRGLQVGMKLQWRNHRGSRQLLWDLASVNTVLDAWSLEQLRQPLSLWNINLVMKAYMCRRGSSNTELFHQLIHCYENSDDELSSRLIRGISLNLLLTRCLLSRTLDRMAEYCVANSSHVLGETVAKLLNLCYSVGYCPTSQERFLSTAADVVFRDKDCMSGMSLLQSALALCFFQHLPQQFIYYIFTVDFMERLDDEVAQCYSKATYPRRVRHYLMELNRAVCLDCPEASVPWFHEKYVQQIIAQEPAQTSSFFLDVQKALTTVVGGEKFVKTSVFSPYGYKIDFQVVLDLGKRPLPASTLGGDDVCRRAVVLHRLRDFSVHEPRLSGQSQLKQRHLELLGYRVFGISESHWHSMYMSEPQAKQLYLREHLFK